jgi:hypothetical protein
VKKGFSMLLLIFMVALFMIITSLFVKVVYNTYSSIKAAETRETAFWLAEAGLEKGKAALAGNINWYTDLPHTPEDNAGWLLNNAVGETGPLGRGTYKVVREENRNRLYSIGRKGKGAVILKLSFSAPPLKFTTWEEL